VHLVTNPQHTTLRAATEADLDLLVAVRLEVLRDVFELGDTLSRHSREGGNPALPEQNSVASLAALEQANRTYYARALPAGEHVACLVFAGERDSVQDASTLAACGGLCPFEELPSPDNPTGHSGLLMNIYTRPACRRQGLARQVLSWLTAAAHARGITRLYLEATPAAAPLYQQAGFTLIPAMMQKPGKI
jgi:GNAT superfamily N-acetyltransferase